jgi:hypothetical protein
MYHEPKKNLPDNVRSSMNARWERKIEWTEIIRAELQAAEKATAMDCLRQFMGKIRENTDMNLVNRMYYTVGKGGRGNPSVGILEDTAAPDVPREVLYNDSNDAYYQLFRGDISPITSQLYYTLNNMNDGMISKAMIGANRTDPVMALKTRWLRTSQRRKIAIMTALDVCVNPSDGGIPYGPSGLCRCISALRKAIQENRHRPLLEKLAQDDEPEKAQELLVVED